MATAKESGKSQRRLVLSTCYISIILIVRTLCLYPPVVLLDAVRNSVVCVRAKVFVVVVVLVVAAVSFQRWIISGTTTDLVRTRDWRTCGVEQ